MIQRFQYHLVFLKYNRVVIVLKKLCSIIIKVIVTNKRLESNVCHCFNSFSSSTGFISFEVILLFNFFNLPSKSVFFTKLALSFLLAKFVWANLAAKSSVVNLLNSAVVIYLL